MKTNRPLALTPRFLLLLGGLVPLLLVSCASVTIRSIGAPAEEGLAIRTIAVAPFVDHATQGAAGSIVRALLAQALEVEAGLSIVELPPNLKVDPQKLDRTRAQEIAVAVNADALLVGTVFEFGYALAAQAAGAMAPTVRFDSRLVSAATGEIVWAVQASGTKELLLTFDSEPVSAVAERVAIDVARDLGARL